jgi:hypothetical protein
VTEPPAGTIQPAEAWTETAEEKALREGALIGKPVRIGPSTGGVNVSYRIEVQGVGAAVYKPMSGEVQSRKSITRGTHYLREVSAFRLDRLLGFRLVPVTVIRTIDGEEGSVQQWIDVGGWMTGHLKVDAARMATLDYLLGNTDRHVFNNRTQEEGRPSAIDNGLCLPRDAGDPIRSRWTHSHLNLPLPDRVLVEIGNLSAERAASTLTELHIEGEAIRGLQRRLQELVNHGRILGTAWGGEIKGT